MANEYSIAWFDAFLDTVPAEKTENEVEALRTWLPLRKYPRVLDICCGKGRHAGPLSAAGYRVTGIDRDEAAVSEARRRWPSAVFVAGDMRDLSAVPGPFDALLCLWQSFGYFDEVTNAAVLKGFAEKLRPGGRLILDLYHRSYFEKNTGSRTTGVGERSITTTNEMKGSRLQCAIEYGDGARDMFDWQLYTPGEIIALGRGAGLEMVFTCAWFDASRVPTLADPRFQIMLGRTG